MVDLQRPVAVAPLAPPARTRLRSRLRAASIGVLSALVVLAGAMYVLAPAGASVRLSVDETATARRYDAETAPRYTLASARQQLPKPPPYTEVVYGSVDASGVPVSNITLRLAGVERKTLGQGATIPIPRAGVAYRAVLHLRPGRYLFTLSLRVGKKYRLAATVRTLQDGRYYRVAATVRPSGIVTFLPVTSY